jgi:hypothetical protein|nr:MAG TPA: hypothetical protein [Caudoviricetes sp.]
MNELKITKSNHRVFFVRILGRLLSRMADQKRILTAFESGDSYPDYLRVIYINRYLNKEQFTRELIEKLDSPRIGIGDIDGNAIYFTMDELGVLNEIVSVALLSGKINFNQETESIYRKVMQEIQQRLDDKEDE